MIKLLSFKLAKAIGKMETHKNASTAVLAYGLELIITSVIGFLLLVLSSLILGRPLSWLYFSIGFAPLRTTGGGFHAKTHLSCFVITVFLFITSVWVSYRFSWNPSIYFVISLISLTLIVLFSPVEASNKPLTAVRKLANRRRSIVISSLFTGFSIILLATKTSGGIINLVWMGIASSSVSLIAAKIHKERRKNYEG